MCVVRGELRIKDWPEGEQSPRASEIGDVRRDLPGIDGVSAQAALLGAFDLAVPISALDEAHHQPPAASPGEIGEPIDERKGPLLIGLAREAEPIPAGKIGGK